MSKKGAKENLIERVEERASQITNRAQMGTISLLSYPEQVDASRMIMFETHSIQRVVQNKTELPKVFTNFENIIGENSSYNVRANSNLRIEKVIYKFPEITDSIDIQQAFFFVYNEEKEMYDLIVRNDVEDMSEKYGFQYDCTGINQYKEGDTIPKGETLFRPTSYDEFGNYGFGINVKSMYLCCDETIEDSILISESFAKMCQSTEVEVIKVPINNNDILLDLYGKDDNYKAFPDIGESTKDKVLCAKRRLNNHQILFDLKSSNMNRTLNSDKKTYGEGQIVDIDIFCNSPIDEIPRANFNEQLLRYIDMTQRFYEQVRDYTRELIDSGVPCSQSIRSWNKRASELTDPGYKFRDEANSEFGHIAMYFTIKRNVGIFRGQKITGRQLSLCPSLIVIWEREPIELRR